MLPGQHGQRAPAWCAITDGIVEQIGDQTAACDGPLFKPVPWCDGCAGNTWGVGDVSSWVSVLYCCINDLLLAPRGVVGGFRRLFVKAAPTFCESPGIRPWAFSILGIPALRHGYLFLKLFLDPIREPCRRDPSQSSHLDTRNCSSFKHLKQG